MGIKLSLDDMIELTEKVTDWEKTIDENRYVGSIKSSKISINVSNDNRPPCIYEIKVVNDGIVVGESHRLIFRYKIKKLYKNIKLKYEESKIKDAVKDTKMFLDKKEIK